MKISLNQYLDEDFDPAADRRARRTPRGPRRGLHSAEHPWRSQHAIVDELATYSALSEAQAQAAFRPTFTSSRHEREWILNYLGPFYDEKIILDVLRRVKGGKEANVYCCSAHPDTGLALLAAKVYRPRMFRNLRNDARYRLGRPILDEQGKAVRDQRYLRALQKGTRAGKDLRHVSWLEHEYQTLQLLHAAGADVPRPLASSSNTILMEYLGEPEMAAPALNEIVLPVRSARPLFERLLWNVELMLAQGRIHGDLSAYNVLYWRGAFKIIDFPQAIDPQLNPDARPILQRDVERLCQYFAGYGIRCDPAPIVDDLWQRYGFDPLPVEAEGLDDEELDGGEEEDAEE